MNNSIYKNIKIKVDIEKEDKYFELSDIKFRANTENVCSYYELSFDKIKDDFIGEIIFGPKSKVATADIEYLLGTNGYNQKIGSNRYDEGKPMNYRPDEYKTYVLELENDMYYVGITRNVKQRVYEHYIGARRAARWTKRYKPLYVSHIGKTHTYIKSQAEVREDNLTIGMMKLYGKDHVRGGRFIQLSQKAVDKALGKKLLQIEQQYAKNLKKGVAKKRECSVEKFVAGLVPRKVTEKDLKPVNPQMHFQSTKKKSKSKVDAWWHT